MTEFKPGQLTQTQFKSEILDREITLSVYLPEDYSDLYKSKVVFCFDGRDFFKFGQIHRLYERLRKHNEVERVIMIGFHYESVTKRRQEFHPQGEFASKTVQAVAKEIFPWIDQTFPTYKVGHARIVLGDSLAGSIALLTALSYPRIISQVGMLSPHVDEVVEMLLHRCQFKENLSIWHVIGKEEIDFKLPTSGEQADFLTPNRTLKKLIEPTVLSYYYEELEGGHNWKTWRKELPKLLQYFLSNQ
ncbi:esterase family protein [Staphylococcus felis]|uniref:Esterase family protein n=1 Tax=Staphylococcus felis TaxID=46127 RepID=A0A2K3Z867_9STAP|nr:alpha/beta hydrolase-fold protein [Staphylococcus felis]AVP36666.1 esterase family protein [Staphylococcus felis]MBH9581520.1 esterase family protein [Staphylococcus felis]MDM8327856.1 alpha/beta hydrolase-fold protein [Staphylococcus felis]MDQ7193097.1 alpha/beta hydrolase-fold protein [Staphylococcus felis]PNZ34060.1 acetylesterase [Staphylococcus felis]